jgi:hypothetical protein
VNVFKSSSVCLPNPVVLDRVYTLCDEISAIQLLPFEDSRPRLSPVSRLPRGAEIEACGDGFDEQTLKVFYEGQFYFVFLRDLETQKKLVGTASWA